MIELLVVLAVMGLILAMVLPGHLAGSDAVELRAAARGIASGLERARSLAISSGAETVFVLDVDNRRFQVPGGAEQTGLPAKASLSMHTGRGNVSNPATGGIRFFPDGSSTGGGIAISENGQGYRISVRWLTGHVEVADAQ